MAFQLKTKTGKWYEVKHKSWVVALFRVNQRHGKVTEIKRTK